jgi:small subunit ribosomal protein S20
LTAPESSSISRANRGGLWLPELFCPFRAYVTEIKKRGKMANTSSAKKATRKIARRAAINKNRRSRVRTYIRKVEEALAAGDKTAAEAAFQAAQPELMRAATKGVLHKNTASRKVSRLAQRLKTLSA